MAFAQTHTRFIAKSKVEGKVLKFEHGVAFLPFDVGAESTQDMKITRISGRKCDQPLTLKWWSIRDHGAIRFGRVARLEFDGNGFSRRLAELRHKLDNREKKKTTMDNELLHELEPEAALYDAFVEADELEFEVLIGEHCTSFTLQLRYGESPRVLEPELIHHEHQRPYESAESRPRDRVRAQ